MKTRAQYHEKIENWTTTMYDFVEALNAQSSKSIQKIKDNTLDLLIK